MSSIGQVRKLAKVGKVAQKLIEKYWPGDLTIILKTLNGQGKTGLRMADSDLVKSLIDQVGAPIIGTSANFHDQKPVKRFKDLDPELTKQADFIIVGECQRGIESTVVDATIDPPKILRQGAVKL